MHIASKFKSRLSTLALALMLPLVPGCLTPFEGPEATFDDLWEQYDMLYGGFEVRDVDWDDVYERYRPLVRDEMSDDEFFELLGTMLAEFDDGHVQMVAPGRAHWYSSRVFRERLGDERFDPELIESNYLEASFEKDEGMGYTLGSLQSGYTYMHLAWTSDQLPKLAAARSMAEASGGLVLDLRHNQGGDFTWALEALSDWTAESRDVFDVRTRNGPSREDFTAWFAWSIEGGGRPLEVPVVVLIDRFTISAGERFVMALDAFEEVIFVGEPTNGAISTMVGRELLNGWTATIAVQEVYAPDRAISYEGTGFPPDELVINDPDQMAAGVDETLERALEILDGA